MNVKKDAAIAIATDALEAEGRNVDNYDISVRRVRQEWEVAFVGKHPRPPGDEVHVYVHRARGTTRTMYGE